MPGYMRGVMATQMVMRFKPRVDSRYANDHIVSHSDMKLPSLVVGSASEILERLDGATEVVGIDEGEFFGAGLVEGVNTLADRGLRVIVAGLDQDYRGRPFDPMPQLLAIAEYVHKTPVSFMKSRGPAH